ncbi:hypothetical protein HU735_14435 [Pseudomonas sp. BW16M2]|uniref:hypothetical protein n=1 Tax=Pseudomonas sp. BW16M2 TaxID=2745489 RepID=UPI001647127B|nr:hypothetical protein [Pseudomonas sp. BW16M2]MBC3436616.1 hypothetical protein [Pseudomonas sp. BW16M2]
MSQNHRLTLLPLAALGLATLMACSAPPQASAKVDAANMTAFTTAMQSALINRIDAANQGTLVGVVTLKLSLDRNNRPIACKAMRSSPAVERLLPVLTVASDFNQLAQLVERQCWHTTYPPVPEGLFENDQVEVIAPLVLMPRLPRPLAQP